MSSRCLLFISLLLVQSTVAAAHVPYGVEVDELHYTLSSGAGLVFSVLRDSGSIPSLKLYGTELNGPRVSCIASGLGSTGTTTKLRVDDQLAVITVETNKENTVVGGLTHYYVLRKGENAIYMATHAEKEPSVGELRWITRMKSSLFPTVPKESDLRGTTGYIESEDIFGMTDQTTRSKYYGNEQARDLTLRGVTGQGIGVFMAYGNRESSAGGPFFRDIQNQTGKNAAEVYNYMNSGHAQTEALRLGVLHGPYALVFTDGSAAQQPDMSFMAELGLKEYTSKKRRGTVKLEGLLGRDAAHCYTVAFANSTAQYWAKVAEDTTTCSGMKPGDYSMIVYKGELSVHTAPVTVKVGKTNSLSPVQIAKDPSLAPALWRIGDWDGTPLEYRNGKLLSLMHPSDARVASWRCPEFTVGESAIADFPACQWRGINNGQVIRFELKADQVQDCELRVGITASIAGGRPRLLLNAWESRLLDGVRQPDSRTMTIGTYRGHNVAYKFQVPAHALQQGMNVLTLNVVSGQRGTGFLSPGYALDCVDLCPVTKPKR